jgi:hypothetical protein
MSKLNIDAMHGYLSRSISSINRNKINGMLAEIDLRNHLQQLGFGNRISQGGWIVRSTGDGFFGHHTNVFFPMTITPNSNYSGDRKFEEPPRRLHTICSTMHQIGIHSYFCLPVIEEDNNPESVMWYSTQLGIPEDDSYHELTGSVNNFIERSRNYNFLKYHTDSAQIPEDYIAEEFSKENLRVTFQNKFMCEMADIDGVFWGERYTYPIEIKEKTCANDNRLGPYFGIDAGPFVKLAFYAAKKGNLHSIFIVKEIDNPEDRNLIAWWFITFETLAQYASWIPRGGGKGMGGGRSTVIMIPRNEFKELNQENLITL